MIIISMPGWAEPATTPSASTEMAIRLEDMASTQPQTMTTHISRDVLSAKGNTNEATARMVIAMKTTAIAISTACPDKGFQPNAR